MIKVINQIADEVWNLKILTGYRSIIAKWGGILSGALVAYQGSASVEGSTLTPLHPYIVIGAGILSAFFAKKSGQFVKEHKEP